MSIIITVSGISGSGKTTIVENTVENYADIYHKVVTTTTRKPRNGEVNGIDYFFMEKNDFEQKIKNGDFLESEIISGNFYGTQTKEIFEKKTVPIIVVGPEGAQNFKKILENKGIECISVFIECSIETAKERISRRDAHNPAALMKRLKNIDESEYKWKDFDYTLRLPEGSNYKNFVDIIKNYLNEKEELKKNNEKKIKLK